MAKTVSDAATGGKGSKDSPQFRIGNFLADPQRFSVKQEYLFDLYSLLYVYGGIDMAVTHVNIDIPTRDKANRLIAEGDERRNKKDMSGRRWRWLGEYYNDYLDVLDERQVCIPSIQLNKGLSIDIMRLICAATLQFHKPFEKLTKAQFSKKGRPDIMCRPTFKSIKSVDLEMHNLVAAGLVFRMYTAGNNSLVYYGLNVVRLMCMLEIFVKQNTNDGTSIHDTKIFKELFIPKFNNLKDSEELINLAMYQARYGMHHSNKECGLVDPKSFMQQIKQQEEDSAERQRWLDGVGNE